MNCQHNLIVPREVEFLSTAHFKIQRLSGAFEINLIVKILFWNLVIPGMGLILFLIMITYGIVENLGSAL